MANSPYKRRFGDRKDGRLLRSLAPFYKFTPFIMKTRNDASNHFRGSVDVSAIDHYSREKRLEGYKGLGPLHIFIAAYIRTISQRPAINRFVSGQHIFARNNIEIVMTVKRALTADATETTIKVEFSPTDTVFDVYYKMDAAIRVIKNGEAENNTEQIAGILFKFPRLMLRFIISTLSAMDYFGLLPQALVNASPFHGSMIITDLGSLGIPPIYHHLYNFGNLPVFISFGAKRRITELDRSGQAVQRKYLDYLVVTDERICDGYYYASAFKCMKQYLCNPKLLELPPEHVEQDVF